MEGFIANSRINILPTLLVAGRWEVGGIACRPLECSYGRASLTACESEDVRGWFHSHQERFRTVKHIVKAGADVRGLRVQLRGITSTKTRGIEIYTEIGLALINS
jgi:hypothetical protein